MRDGIESWGCTYHTYSVFSKRDDDVLIVQLKILENGRASMHSNLLSSTSSHPVHLLHLAESSPFFPTSLSSHPTHLNSAFNLHKLLPALPLPPSILAIAFKLSLNSIVALALFRQ